MRTTRYLWQQQFKALAEFLKKDTLLAKKTTATEPSSSITTSILIDDALTINADNSPQNSKKHVLLYFSASWCPPCRQFTPVLSRFYTQHKDSKAFEIIFCSWDQTDKEFGDYYAKMPWLAMERDGVDALASALNIQTIPSLVVLDAQTGAIVTKKGRTAVSEDPDAEKFPWAVAEFQPHHGAGAAVVSPQRAFLIGLAATAVASGLLWLYSDAAQEQEQQEGTAATVGTPTSSK